MQGNVNIPDSTITSALTFRNLVLMNMQQLTNFPYIEKDFDALTDYELLCLVVKYLNDVIDNQNEQNDSITRMYESFLALQDYVNDTKDELEDAFNNLDDYVRNYFDNLDVQEEINNKLDQMLEDGVLEQIIEQFLQSTAIWCFDTVNDMKQATNLTNGSYAKTLGYYAINDSGGALYKITNTTSQTDFQEELSSGLYATLITNNKILIKQLGAKSGSTNNITSLLEFAINTGLPVENDNIEESFYITTTINTTNNIKLKNIKLVCDFIGDNYLFDFTDNTTGYDLEMENVIIDGDSKCIGVNNKLETKDANNFILKNVEIYGMSSENHITGIFPTESAITMRGVNCLAENCNVHDNQGHGLMIYAPPTGNASSGVFKITNCKAYGNGLGTYLAQGIGSYSDLNNAKCFISNCYAYGNGASGIASHGINEVIIENSIANNNNEHGLVVQQTNNSIIDNCIANDNAYYGVRVQGDFSKPENERFVNNVCVMNNKIKGNGINVGVKATNIVCKDNVITLTSGQKPFYTDNGQYSRNNGSNNVSFINNTIIGDGYSAEAFRDYYNNFIINNNTDIKGNLLPNGFLVYSGNSNSLNMYVSTADLHKSITPTNIETPDSTAGYTGVIVSGDTFTNANEINEDTYLVYSRYEAKSNMTFVIECPNGTVPWVRSRDASKGLIADYLLINTVENNGNINKVTLTITKDDSNANTESIKYYDIALRTVKYEKLSAGTYNFKIDGTEGLILNK